MKRYIIRNRNLNMIVLSLIFIFAFSINLDAQGFNHNSNELAPNSNQMKMEKQENIEVENNLGKPQFDTDCFFNKMIICHKTNSQTNPWVTIEINKSAWEHHKAHGDYKGPCRCEECPTKIEVLQENVNLGTFFPGNTYDLPSDNGDGNIIEFLVSGNEEATYTVEYTMNLKCDMGDGEAEITSWTWEKSDLQTQGRYGQCHRKRHHCFNCVSLFKRNGMGKCGNIARFRMTAEELRITGNATPGAMKFGITLSATANL